MGFGCSSFYLGRGVVRFGVGGFVVNGFKSLPFGEGLWPYCQDATIVAILPGLQQWNSRAVLVTGDLGDILMGFGCSSFYLGRGVVRFGVGGFWVRCEWVPTTLLYTVKAYCLQRPCRQYAPVKLSKKKKRHRHLQQ